MSERARPMLSVCFPAYQERATVAAVVSEAHALLRDAGIDFEILVCDDGSTDGTGAIVRDLGQRLPRVRALHNPRNLGIRATFERLYAEASGELVFLNSVDRQWDTALVLDLLPLAAHADIIIASRIRKPYGPARRLVSWAFNALPRLLFGVRTFDAGAVKLVRREVLERFTLVSRSPFSEAERLIRAARAGYRILDHPVEVQVRTAGVARGARPGAVLAALSDVWRVWWALRERAPASAGRGARAGGRRRARAAPPGSPRRHR